MIGDKDAGLCSDLLEYLSDELSDVHKDKMIADDNVATICDQSISSLSKATVEAAAPFWSRAFARVRLLRESGLHLRTTLDTGELAFRAGEYEAAVEVWNELSPDLRPVHYQDAQAELLIARWELSQHVAGVPTNTASVADAYIRRRKYRQALELLYKYPDESALERLRGMLGEDREAQVTATAALLKAKCRARKWSEALDFVPGRRTGVGEAPLLRNTFILEIAGSEHLLAETSPGEIDRIRDYLKRTILEGRWDASNKVTVVGAAIEKADRILDSLAFYEMVWKHEKIPASAEEKAFARARWVKCKDRQAMRSDERNQKESATKYTKEAEEFARRWGISLLDIPEYPPVSNAEGISIVAEHIAASETPSEVDERTQAIRTLFNSGMAIPRIAVAFGLDAEEVALILKR